VNAVVIPGVNDAHLPQVTRAVRAAGAFLVNLVPLISAPEHGTRFGLDGQRGPDAAELEQVQRACEVDARLMRHCRQCRADAVGRLGEDRFESFTLARLPPGPVRDAAELRAERRAAVERARAAAGRERDEVLSRLAVRSGAAGARVAVATKGGGLVDQHFGHAREFLVYDVSPAGARLVGRRTADTYCSGGDGDDDALEGVIRALSDCQAVLVARIGHCPRGQLAAAGIEASQAQAHRPIEAGLLEWLEARLDAPGRKVDAA
jgi:nitrogen fixation protein NifB